MSQEFELPEVKDFPASRAWLVRGVVCNELFESQDEAHEYSNKINGLVDGLITRDAARIFAKEHALAAVEKYKAEQAQQSATVSSDEAMSKAYRDIFSPKLAGTYGTWEKAWNAALQYAATQRSERDKEVDEVIHDNGMSEQSQTQRYKAHMFDKIRKIWRGEK